jgi:hypothetical protein
VIFSWKILIFDVIRRGAALPACSQPGATQRRAGVLISLRMADHPGVVFKDGPSGRRAALAFGPDVWEVVKVLHEIDERGEAAVAATAEVLALPEAKVRVAMHYYAAYPEEIDAEIAEADRVSGEAERAWRIERRLLA